MMSGSKAPDFDTYELLRATHYHNSTQGLSPTYEQAHVGLDLLTLVSYKLFAIKSFTIPKASLSRLFGTVRG